MSRRRNGLSSDIIRTARRKIEDTRARGAARADDAIREHGSAKAAADWAAHRRSRYAYGDKMEHYYAGLQEELVRRMKKSNPQRRQRGRLGRRRNASPIVKAVKAHVPRGYRVRMGKGSVYGQVVVSRPPDADHLAWARTSRRLRRTFPDVRFSGLAPKSFVRYWLDLDDAGRRADDARRAREQAGRPKAHVEVVPRATIERVLYRKRNALRWLRGERVQPKRSRKPLRKGDIVKWSRTGLREVDAHSPVDRGVVASTEFRSSHGLVTVDFGSRPGTVPTGWVVRGDYDPYKHDLPEFVVAKYSRKNRKRR